MIRFVTSVYRIFRPFIKKISHDNIFAIAGQSAFFLILSSVPLMMFAVSIFQNMHIPQESLERILAIVFNEKATKSVSSFLSNLYRDATGISVITLIGTLWSASKGVHAITNGLNRIHHTYENRNWLFLRLRAMLYTVLVFAIVFASMVIIMLGSSLNEWLSKNISYMPAVVTMMLHLRYVIIFVYIVVMFALLYRNFPNLSRENRRQYGFLSQLPGALFTAVAWFVLTIVISIYVTDFNGFSIYGGLLRLAVIMIWLYFCMVCLMLGAEFNYYYNRQIRNFYTMLRNRFRRNTQKKQPGNKEKDIRE